MEKKIDSKFVEPSPDVVRRPISDIHYGLIVLIELAEAYESEGYSLLYIANKHNFPLEKLSFIVNRLEAEGLIESRPDKPGWVWLKDAPGDRWIFEIVPMVKKVLLGQSAECHSSK